MFLCSHCVPIGPFFRSLTPHRCSSSRRFALSDRHFFRSRRINLEIDIFSRLRRHGVRVRVFSCKDEYRAGFRFVKKRKIVEHVLLLQAKANLSDFDEKDMLDFLYTSQYHMSGIIAISLGRVENPSRDNVTHAVYMRFQGKEGLARYLANPHFLEVLKEHVFPYCYV